MNDNLREYRVSKQWLLDIAGMLEIARDCIDQSIAPDERPAIDPYRLLRDVIDQIEEVIDRG